MKKFLLVFLIAISPIFLCAFVQKDFDKMIGFKIKSMRFYSSADEYIYDLKKVFNKIPNITIKVEDLKITNDLELINTEVKPSEVKYQGFPALMEFNKLNYTLYKDGNQKRIEFLSQAVPNENEIIESHCVYDEDKSYHVYDSFYPIDKKVLAKGVSPYCNNYLKAFDYLFEKTFFNIYQATGRTNALVTLGKTNRNGFYCDLVHIKNPNYVLGDDVYNVEGFACVSERYGFFVEGELKYTLPNGMQTVMRHTVTEVNLGSIPYEKFVKAPYVKTEKFRMEMQ